MANEHDHQVIQAVKELHEQMNAGFSQMSERFAKVDERLDRLENEMNTRFEQVDKRFDDVDERMNQLQDSMDLLAKKNFDNETDIYRIKKAIGQY